MIIKKSDYNKFEKFNGTWPFSVDQVKLRPIFIRGRLVFALLYRFKKYALSGLLEGYGFKPLESSGIWSSDPEISQFYKSLSPFFEFCKLISEKI